jgi:hypothetical protein
VDAVTDIVACRTEPAGAGEKAMTDLEQQLAELAAYHVGLFTGAASRLTDCSPQVCAHALFVLGEEVKMRRDQWLAVTEPAGTRRANPPTTQG